MSVLDFSPAAVAAEPPEARGLTRDGVRLLVAEPGRLRHTTFASLAGFLGEGDLVVVNTSRTLAAAVDARRAGAAITVHFSTELADGDWAVELRRGGRPAWDGVAGERIDLPGGAELILVDSYPAPGMPGSRLWRAKVTEVPRLLARHGRPITYDYLAGRWPLRRYQTVFATEAGSAEMPSAGRPFADRLVTQLVSRGVTLAPIALHTGVSSQEHGEPPLPERFTVPAATARLVNSARGAGARVVAVGTTVTRALETVATEDGTVRPAQGWTDLVLGERRRARTVTGLITGWHAPGASHLALLEAVAGADLVNAAYREAVAAGYRWHEFGDSCLLLPAQTRIPRWSAAGDGLLGGG
jgi:S-adenosylmethionine:tRNA ribosyltransferase-isomerase